MAKPYKFLLWERKHIYPLIIRNYQSDVHDDLSSVGGGSDHLGNSYHGGDGHGEHGDKENGHGRRNELIIFLYVIHFGCFFRFLVLAVNCRPCCGF